jgi:hypothetical protein
VGEGNEFGGHEGGCYENCRADANRFMAA